MFSTPALLLSALTLLTHLTAPCQGALSVLTPNSAAPWYQNNTVTTTWTSAPADTPSNFTVLLNNTGTLDLLGGQLAQLAQNVQTAPGTVTIALDSNTVPVGDNYILLFVNSSAPAQIYTTSQEFTIAAGNRTTSSSAGSATATSTSSAYIPGNTGSAFPTSAIATASATTTTSTSAGYTSTSSSINVVLLGLGLLIMAAGVGATVGI